MTEIEKAKAVWRICANLAIPLSGSDRARMRQLLRMIEKAEQAEGFEAFKREVSDAVEDYCGYVPPDSPSHPITRFIIAKPDPLVEALRETYNDDSSKGDADALRAALAKRGLEVREIEG